MRVGKDSLGSAQRMLDDDWSTWVSAPETVEDDSPEQKAAADLTLKLGYKNFALVYRLVVPKGAPVQVSLSNWSPEWRSRYWTKGYLRLDPVFAQMAICFRPFAWDELPSPSPVQSAFFQDAARHGIVDGVSGTVRFGSDEAGFFSLSSDCKMDAERQEAAMAAMFLFTARAFESVRDRVLAMRNISPIQLTDRQRDALRGVMLGRSMRQSSESMGISISALTNHLEAARKKLGETNNKAAVRKAVAMNLLTQYRHMAPFESRKRGSS